MRKYLTSVSQKWIVLIYVVCSVICCGMGMGIPVFNILFSFVAGCVIAERELFRRGRDGVLSRISVQAFAAAAFTLLLMCIIWGFMIRMVFDPATNFRNFGIPMILYSPKPSFVGWIVLMVVLSPALQLLVTVFTAFLVLVKHERQSRLY